MEYNVGVAGPVDEPQPRKSTAMQWNVDERWEMVDEYVREEPPQKWRNRSVGLGES
jgi:hypothetical protein